MATLRLTKADIDINLEEGQTILEGTLSNGINHAHACGGHAVCSTCRVYIEQGLDNINPRNESEQKLANKLGLSAEIRLACQSTLAGNATIRRLVLDDIDQQIIVQGAQQSSRSLGEQKEASILFVDIADYTAFTEKTPAYDVVHVLNRYFYIAGNVIKKYKGQIIDYYGDGFLAIFGLDDDSDHPHNLLKAGFALQEAVNEFDHNIQDLVNSDFRIRLGGHLGSIIWGTIGIESMQKQAAIGDAVNFASRMEQANKELYTQFLISEDLFAKVSDSCVVSEEYEIQVKGKSGLYKVYALDHAH